jgi:hypothetical protein
MNEKTMTQTKDVFMICADTPPDINLRVEKLKALGWHDNVDFDAYDKSFSAIAVLDEIDSDDPVASLEEARKEFEAINQYLRPRKKDDGPSRPRQQDDVAMCSADGREFILMKECLGGDLVCVYTAPSGWWNDIFDNAPEIYASGKPPFQYHRGGFAQASFTRSACLIDSPLGAGLYFATNSADRVAGWQPRQ